MLQRRISRRLKPTLNSTFFRSVFSSVFTNIQHPVQTNSLRIQSKFSEPKSKTSHWNTIKRLEYTLWLQMMYNARWVHRMNESSARLSLLQAEASSMYNFVSLSNTHRQCNLRSVKLRKVSKTFSCNGTFPMSVSNNAAANAQTTTRGVSESAEATIMLTSTTSMLSRVVQQQVVSWSPWLASNGM